MWKVSQPLSLIQMSFSIGVPNWQQTRSLGHLGLFSTMISLVKTRSDLFRMMSQQFGWHYERVRDFRRVFRQTLHLVLSQYRAARIELVDEGMALHHSLPPVAGRGALIRGAQGCSVLIGGEGAALAAGRAPAVGEGR